MFNFISALFDGLIISGPRPRGKDGRPIKWRLWAGAILLGALAAAAFRALIQLVGL